MCATKAEPLRILAIDDENPISLSSVQSSTPTGASYLQRTRANKALR